MGYALLRAGFNRNFGYGEIIGYSILIYVGMCFARVNL